MSARVIVIGSGPNGLTAAAVMAREGHRVRVLEAADTIGGAARTAELTLPGFHHDVGSSVYPIGVASPIFRELALQRFGLRWIEPEVPVAHPLDGGDGVAMEHSLAAMRDQLGREDGARWQELFAPLVERWDELVPELLKPLVHLPQHPWLMARFGSLALLPASTLARTLFRGERARALFCGVAGHAVRPLDSPLSAAICLVLTAAAHGSGWPVAEGGAQSVTDALRRVLEANGGDVQTGARVLSVAGGNGDVLHVRGEGFEEAADCVLAATTPRSLVAMAGQAMQSGNRRLMERFQYGPGSFKVDWALREPIPWTAAVCRASATVHVGGSLAEMVGSEHAPWRGRVVDRPFLILTQPSVCDASRAPDGAGTAWAYCHVPNGWTGDALERIEAQVERFAPGFRDCILARRTWSCAELEAWNPNLVGGDLSGGAMTALQMAMRPTPRLYQTSIDGLLLCSSSTPPGGGVHGMCGYGAARAAMRYLARGQSSVTRA